jgi:cell division protein FtsI (penicillin-binding protein 3)
MTSTGRLGFVHATLALFAIAIVVRAARVQLVSRKIWKDRAAQQQTTRKPIPAPRGEILDATGQVVAQNHPMVRIEIAPRELRNPKGVMGALTRVGVANEYLTRIADTSRPWVTIPGRYLAVDVADALADPGVHSTPVAAREYTGTPGSLAFIGRVDSDGKPVEGLELALDGVLAGRAGAQTYVRDARRTLFESPTAKATPPVTGHSVTLTINQDLQEIVEGALSAAVTKLEADGGDIVVLDPHSGEILAMVSLRRTTQGTTRVATTSAVTEPFEPGSTLKPFIAAALLDRDLVGEGDFVETGSGPWTINGRTITDEHPIGRASLADVIQWSSNIGIVKFAERLSPRAQFETLRDFGFGTATGVVFPSEAGGRLAEPARWSRQSAASIAMGYELSVTPLQLALAYAAFANGGQLFEPAFVREIRSPDGAVVFRHQPRLVRRVMSAATAERVRTMLMRVVDGGTAFQADLSNFSLAGKTGTPRATVGGRYVPGHYNPNFIGLFPGDAPQLVIAVRLANPTGSIFGGTTAAPLTKIVIEAALAASNAALDRGKLAQVQEPPKPRPTTAVAASQVTVAPTALAAPHAERCPAGATSEGVADDGDDQSPTDDDPIVVRLPASPQGAQPKRAARTVPDVRGLALRDAVRSLHCAGFRVQLVRGAGSTVPTTIPAAGSLTHPGALVRLLSSDR